MSFIAPDGSTLIDLRSFGHIERAKGYFGSTGQMSSAAATVNAPMSIFNPSNSGKSILITSIIVSSGTGSLVGKCYLTTADPGYANALNIKNAKAQGANSVVTGKYINTDTALPGSGLFRQLYNTYSQEMMPNGFGILLPAGADNGVTTFMETYASGIGGISATWFEF